MTTQYIKKDKDGTFYFKDKEMTIRHREDGPAVERYSGSKSWHLHGECHREDGPAVIFCDGSKLWFLNNKSLTEEEHHEKLSRKEPTISIEGKTFTVDELKELIRKAKKHV